MQIQHQLVQSRRKIQLAAQIRKGRRLCAEQAQTRGQVPEASASFQVARLSDAVRTPDAYLHSRLMPELLHAVREDSAACRRTLVLSTQQLDVAVPLRRCETEG